MGSEMTNKSGVSDGVSCIKPSRCVYACARELSLARRMSDLRLETDDLACVDGGTFVMPTGGLCEDVVFCGSLDRLHRVDAANTSFYVGEISDPSGVISITSTSISVDAFKVIEGMKLPVSVFCVGVLRYYVDKLGFACNSLRCFSIEPVSEDTRAQYSVDMCCALHSRICEQYGSNPSSVARLGRVVMGEFSDEDWIEYWRRIGRSCLGDVLNSPLVDMG